MSHDTTVRRILQAWSQEWEAAHLDASVRKLITLATYDLYYGPIGDGAVGDPATDQYGNENEWAGYPGFTTATHTISQALTDLPGVLYLDTESESILENEPHPDTCPSCEGEGEIDGDKCDNCNGDGTFDPCYDSICQVEQGDLKAAVVGKELSKYV